MSTSLTFALHLLPGINATQTLGVSLLSVRDSDVTVYLVACRSASILRAVPTASVCSVTTSARPFATTQTTCGKQ